MKQARRFVYLFAGLGYPFFDPPMDDEVSEEEIFLEVAKRAVLRRGASLSVTLIKHPTGLTKHRKRHTSSIQKDLRWTIEWPDGKRDDTRARHFADELRMAESVHGQFWDDISLIPVPKFLLSRTHSLSMSEFQKWAIEDGDIFNATSQISSLKINIRIEPEMMLWVWTSLPAFASDKVKRAAAYLLESHERGWFANRERTDMIRHDLTEIRPDLPTDIARLESAVVNAFKVVEALIGKVDRNANAIRNQLIANGFPGNQRMWFSPKRTLAEELDVLTRARNARAAHGFGSRQNIITYYEVMGWQTCAQILVSETLFRANSVRIDLFSILQNKAKMQK